MDPYDSSLHSLNKKFMMESQNDELEEGPLSDLSEIAIDSKEKGNYNECLLNEIQLELFNLSKFIIIIHQNNIIPFKIIHLQFRKLPNKGLKWQTIVLRTM